MKAIGSRQSPTTDIILTLQPTPIPTAVNIPTGGTQVDLATTQLPTVKAD